MYFYLYAILRCHQVEHQSAIVLSCECGTHYIWARTLLHGTVCGCGSWYEVQPRTLFVAYFFFSPAVVCQMYKPSNDTVKCKARQPNSIEPNATQPNPTQPNNPTTQHTTITRCALASRMTTSWHATTAPEWTLQQAVLRYLRPAPY